MLERDFGDEKITILSTSEVKCPRPFSRRNDFFTGGSSLPFDGRVSTAALC